MAKASKADVEKAFTAGFNSDKIELDSSAELEEETPAVKLTAESNKDLETPPGATEEIDEWDGVPAALKTRFEDLSANLAKVQNIANSASGRANKLQSQLAKQENAVPVEKPKPTSEQIQEAMTSSEKRDKLGEDFPEFAVVFDEMGKSVSTSVGAAIDNLRAELRVETQNINDSVMAEFEIKRSLDNKHPGWETTVQDTEFKKWAYEGGPSEQESAYYDSLLFQASQAAPEDSAAIYDNANKYYTSMLENYPVWASEKGTLYGDSTGKSAISLLDLYEENKAPEQAPETPAPAQELSDNRFEENLTPTSGRSRQAPAATTDEVEKAFSAGFNS